MSALRSELRWARRSLRTHRGVTAVAIATLALTIGLNTTVFSIVNAVVFRPLPFTEPHNLVTLCERDAGGGGDWCGASVPDIMEVAARVPGLETAGAARSWPFLLKGADGVEGVNGGLATPEVLAALRVRPILGRFIETRDLGDNWARVVVLSNETWRVRFGAQQNIVGQQVVLDDEPHTIIGVLPPIRVPSLDYVQMWRPIHFDPRAEDRRDWRGFRAFARIRNGMDIDAVGRDVAAVGADIQRRHFSDRDGWSIQLRSWHDVVVGSVRTTMYLFVGAVGFVLLIGCANVANLLLTQATVRRRELAMRAALGATRLQLARALLFESLLITLAGTVAGFVIGAAATRAVIAIVPQGIPRIDEVGLDPMVFAFLSAVAILTTLLIGMAPALRATRLDLSHDLAASGGRTGTSQDAARLGPALIVGQIALAVVLVTGAGMLARSFVMQMRWDPGFEQDHLLTTWALASPGRFSSRAQVADFFARAEDEVRSIPGVVSVGTGSAGPLFGGDGEGHFTIDGRDTPTEGSRQAAFWYDIGPTYFRTLGIPVLWGRDIATTDVVGSPKVAIVNESFVRRYFGAEEPIGRVVHMVEHEDDFTIVGVVRNVPAVRPGEAPPPQIFWSNRQVPRPATYFIVRVNADQAATGRAITERLRAFAPDMRLSSIRTLDDFLDDELVRPRFSALLLSTFGLLAALLSAIGTYGLVAYSVSQRRKEFGVRMALGAQQSAIISGVLRQGLRLAGIAIVVGVAGALVLTRLLESQLAGVSATDPPSFVMGALLLLFAAVAACVVPARRASRVDPVESIRVE